MPLKDGTTGNTRGHAINGRSGKDIRRQRAFARDALFKKLTLDEKLARINKNFPNGANRQRARYEKLPKSKEVKTTIKMAK